MARRRIRRRQLKRDAADEREHDGEEPPLEVDLHGLRPDEALVRLGQALHRARVQGEERIDVITGRGIGNPTREPVLRGRVEAWLKADGTRTYGVRGFRRIARGGCLRVELTPRSGRESTDS